MTSASLSLLLKLVEALIAGFLRALPGTSFFGGDGDGHGKSNQSEGTGGGPRRCPYQVLGLEEGNTTLEEATKARRRLALKWHPDRNIDNTEEATRKMQEINDSYHQIERMLSDVDGEGGDDSSGGDSEYEDRPQPQSKSARKKAGNSRRNRERRDEEAEFEREMKAEFRDFERAQRNADGWGAAGASPFARPTSTSFKDPSPSGNGSPTMGNEVKGKSKAARKRARRKANKENRRGQTCSSTTTSDVPFHRLSPQKRCEIKFGSSQLARSPVVTAILAKTYHVLQIYCLCSDPCGPIPLPSEEEGKQTIVVTPLMIASYLGDYAAADALISCVGDSWAVAVLAKSHMGEDSLTLALEAKGISEQLYEEARGNMAHANTDDERAKQEEIIEQHRKGVDGALRLVERLRTMKKFAEAENRKKMLRVGKRMLTIALVGGVVWHFGWAMRIVRFVWSSIWFIVKWGGILLVFYCFPVGTILAYLAYWMYTREPASSDCITTKLPSDKTESVESIDFFCTDGEKCTAEGDSCTDGITEECCGMAFDSSICECGANLKWACHQTNACLDRMCETEGPSGNTNGPSDTMKLENETAHTVDIDPAAVEGGMWEGAAVVTICVLVIGALLYRLAESVKSGPKKKRAARRGKKSNYN